MAWQEARTPEQCIADREKIIKAIERADSTMWHSGWRDSWFAECEENIRQLCATVNGQLLEDLARGMNHKKLDRVQYFRHGELSRILVAVFHFKE